MPPPPAPALLPLPVHDVAFGGKGVGRAGGLAVFVPFTIPGEEVTVRLTKRKKNFAEAELVSIEQASPDRVEPPCPYFGACGGCAYQHIAYGRQLAIKAAQVEQTLRRLGRLEEVPMRPPVGSPEPYGYRNRIRVHVEGGTVGFYRHDRHALVDIEQCPIASPAVNAELARLRQALAGDGDYTLRGRGEGEHFVQTNDEMAAALLEVVRGVVPSGFHTLVDAYAGAGFFAKGLLDRFERIIGIEEHEGAVHAARRGAGPAESYLAGAVEQQLGEVLAMCEPARTCLVLDPPATGVAPRALEFILGSEPAELVYVSCNPGTLARDLAMLCRTYKLRGVTPLDMFPQTAEIEVVAHLSIF